MDKLLIDLQRNCKATCVFVKEEEYKQLSPIVSMKANVSDSFLFSSKPPFAEKINSKCEANDICYFVIKGIEEISVKKQERFLSLVKDRELNGYKLPDNCIIVFTIKDRDNLKNISQEIYKFSVIAF